MPLCRAPLADLDEKLCNLSALRKVTLRSVLNDNWEPEDEEDAALFGWIINNLPNLKGKKGVNLGYIGNDARTAVVSNLLC